MKWKGVKERLEREREIESQYSIFHVSVRKTELLGERRENLEKREGARREKNATWFQENNLR